VNVSNSPQNVNGPEAKRAALARLLRAKADRSKLSVAQERLWFLDQLEPNNAAYNVQAAVTLRGTLDVAALQSCLDELLRRHEVLRSEFLIRRARPFLAIAPEANLGLPVVELGSGVAPERAAAVAERAHDEARRPFDLAKSPLLRATLIRVTPEEHVLLLTAHRIAADEASLEVVVRELATLYDAFSRGEPSPLPAPGRQHADFTVSQRQWVRSGAFEEQLSYWVGQLGENLPAVDVPADRPRPAAQTYRGARLSFALPESVTEALRGIGKHVGGDLATTVFAAYLAFLHRYTDQDDLVVGIVSPGAARTEFGGVVGPLTNPLPLRVRVPGDIQFNVLLMRTLLAIQAARANGDLPFESLVDELQPERDLGRSPIFQVAFQSRPQAEPIEAGGMRLEPLEVGTVATMYDLTLAMAEGTAGVEAWFDYTTDLFDQTTIERLAGHFRRLLDGVVKDPGQPISRLPLLSEEELHDMLVTWNGASMHQPSDECIHHIFEAQAARTPDAIAVVFGGEQLTYRELDRRGNQLARHLQTRAVGPEVVVGLCLERSIDSVVAMLGVLKAGGAYVPLDPAYPKDRLLFMVRDAGVRLMVTRQELAERLTIPQVGVVALDADAGAIAARDTTAPRSAVGPHNLAYLIYTSGSTGQPKGVLGLHRGMVNVIHWMRDAYSAEPDERAAQRTSLSFVDSVWETFAHLCNGIGLVVIPDAVVKDPGALVERLAGAGVTRMVVVPSLLRVLLNGDIDLAGRLPALRYWFSSGEALTADVYRRFGERLPGRVLVNVYGTSEVSADATFHDTRQDGEVDSVPIGRPLPNVRVYVLDRQSQPVPPGVPGEICVGGVGVARGYLKRAQLNQERFVANPFADGTDGPLYRTGDRARFRPDGRLEYLGRMDQQVKVRGFRIEIGEVEAVIGQHPWVRDVVVVAREETPGDLRLVAYVVPDEDQKELVVNALRGFLKTKLPDYMMPSTFALLEALPRTASGKVDRPSLPLRGLSRAGLDEAYVAPRTPIEEKLAAIFSRVMGIERIGANDDFFALGGHSLLVIGLFAAVRDEFDVELPLRILYDVPSVAGLARAVETIRLKGPGGLEDLQGATAAGEAHLDPDIRPAEAAPNERMWTPARVFLTGATGFLGSFLLYELLEQTDAEVHCLIRASDETAAMERLQRKMESHEIWREKHRSRIVPVVGDLTKPLLGLSREQFDALAGEMDSVYHCGATVNFVFPYIALKAANVLGTEEAIRLASQTKLKPLHHISLTDVGIQLDSQGRRIVVGTEAKVFPSQTFMSGYSTSKWVAERLVFLAQARGLPVIVYRPGFIEGHAETGISNTTSQLSLMLKGCIQMGTVADLDTLVDIATVDYVSRAVIHLSQQPKSLGRIFHMVNPHPAHLRQVMDWVRELGYSVKTIAYPEWRDQLLNDVTPDNALYPLIPYVADEEVVRTPLATPTDVESTVEALADTKISCAPVDAEAIGRCVDFLVRIGFMEPGTAARA
jgi:amino acid adenylation domain-containing protein/thioester reductase-like protein